MTSTGTDLFRLPRLTVHNSTRMSEFRRLAKGRLAPTMLRDRHLPRAGQWFASQGLHSLEGEFDWVTWGASHEYP
jgi:hypothetical protein